MTEGSDKCCLIPGLELSVSCLQREGSWQQRGEIAPASVMVRTELFETHVRPEGYRSSGLTGQGWELQGFSGGR